eukprot:scaffold28699_cov93-Isochrysis_galbana.AAC.1
MHTTGKFKLPVVACCTWLSDRKASSGSACRGCSTPPSPLARATTHLALSSATAPDATTASSSGPPLSFHLPICSSPTSTSGNAGRCGGGPSTPASPPRRLPPL